MKLSPCMSYWFERLKLTWRHCRLGVHFGWRATNVEEGCEMDSEQMFFVDENIPSGRITTGGQLVDAVSVRDREQETLTGVFTAMCSGAYCAAEDEDLFTIDPATGHLILKTGVQVNYERPNDLHIHCHLHLPWIRHFSQCYHQNSEC